MGYKQKLASVVCLVAIAWPRVSVHAQSAVPVIYSITQLNTLGGNFGEALGINGAGQIVGDTSTNTLLKGNKLETDELATFWNANSATAVNLGALAGTTNSQASAINSSGQIVGNADNSSTNFHATAWPNSGSVAIDIGTLGGSDSQAFAINDAGQIVGLANLAGDAVFHAAFWTNRTSHAIDLGTLGGDDSQANAINGIGQIFGSASVPGDLANHATFWPTSSSSAIDLGTLGGDNSQANGANGLGQIVGDAFTLHNAADHATFWPSGGSAPTDLGTLGGTNSQALAINTSSQIVGWANTSGGVQRAALWISRTSSAIDLTTLIPPNSGWVLLQANAINDSGRIVGYGTISGQTNAFVLVPISPPTTPTISVSGANVTLTFRTVANLLYDVQSRTDLGLGVWSTITSNIAGTGGVVTNINVGGALVTKRFYRVGMHF